MSIDTGGFQPKRKRCPRCPAETSFWDQRAVRKHWGRLHKGFPISELEETLKQQVEDCPFCATKNSSKSIVIANIFENNLCWLYAGIFCHK